jgi:type II pantothenate kinase
MVYQVIGMLSVFAAKSKNIDCVVVTGNGSGNLLGRRVLDDITSMYNVRFEYPESAEFTTAIGAALSVSETGRGSVAGTAAGRGPGHGAGAANKP